MNEIISDIYANVQIGIENFYKNRIVPNTKKYISMELVAIVLELYAGSIAIETKYEKLEIDFKNANIRLESSYEIPQKLKEDTLSSITDSITDTVK